MIPDKNNSNECQGVYLIVHDISTEKKNGLKLEKRISEIQREAEMKSQFLSLVSVIFIIYIY